MLILDYTYSIGDTDIRGYASYEIQDNKIFFYINGLTLVVTNWIRIRKVRFYMIRHPKNKDHK